MELESSDDRTSAAASRYTSFWVEAMLPGFFVVDANLDVVNNNQLAYDLLEAAGLARGSYTFRPRSDLADAPIARRERLVSITDDLVHHDYRPHMLEFVRLFWQQRALVDEFNASGVPARPAELAERFRGVPVAVKDVHLYAYAPRWTPGSADRPMAFRGGVRLAPTAGIKLNIADVMLSADSVPIPNSVDIVCAWRILCHWHEDRERIARLTFHGGQPAFHDATARLRLWESSQRLLRAEAEANLTRLWSHALGTDVRTVNSARDSARDLHRLCDDQQRPRLTEATYLWTEKAYSELNSHVGFLRIVRSLAASRVARAAELRTATRRTNLSGLVASSFASALRTLIADREFENRIHPRHADAVAARRHEWLEVLLHVNREPSRDEECAVAALVSAVGVRIEAWDLDAGAAIMAPTRSAEYDDEAVTSRTLRLLFEEYSYNTLKALLKQPQPVLSLELRRIADTAAVSFRIANSCRISDPALYGVWTAEDESLTRDNQKGLFTNYRVFSELFGPGSAYRRDVTANQFAVTLQFPGNAFIIDEKEPR
jgi:hypothetical protein